MEQFVSVPLSVYSISNFSIFVTKQELPKYNSDQNATYHKDTIIKEINQHLTTKATTHQVLDSPRNKLSNSNTLILDGIETVVLLRDFAQRLERKNVPIPVIYFTLLEAASITPDLVVNSHAKGKDGGAWIPLKIRTTKVAETLHARICSIWFCAQFGRSSETLSVKGQRIFTFKDIICYVHTGNT